MKSFCIALVYLGMFGIKLNAQDSSQIERLRKKNLVYYWIGTPCSPNFGNAESYGFKIACVGCKSKLRYVVHNRRVARKINRVYGKNWFQDNIRSSQ